MKPRSRKEQRFVELAAMLPPLDEKRKEWAKRLFPATAIYHSHRGNNCEFWCQDCGTVVSTTGKWLLADRVGETWTCPNCGRECKVEERTTGFRASEERWVTLVDVFRGIQVFRTFEVCRTSRRTLPAEYDYHEIFQNWLLEDGSEVITTKQMSRGYNYQNWVYSSPYGIGKHNGHCTGYFVYEDVYDLEGNYIFPGHKVLPVLKRNGWSARNYPKGASPVDVAKCLLRGPEYETLMKAGQSSVVAHLLTHPSKDLADYWPSLKICLRNGYKITDAGAWFDYIDDLKWLQLDVHNAHYVCPQHLRRAHAETGRRRARIEAKRRAEAAAREARKFEKAYKRAKRPFLGLAFGDDRVRVAVLNSVDEVRQEGAAMHHCVFQNEYYKHGDNLLLSARAADTGKRLETVEISLRSFNVLQSRALQNGKSDEHDHILDLCRRNVPELKRRAARMTVPLRDWITA